MEWIEFVRVEAVPRPGEIVAASETWGEPAGGGGVAAVELARLAGEASLFCVLGDDELGRRSREELEAASVHVFAPTTTTDSGAASVTSTRPASGRSR